MAAYVIGVDPVVDDEITESTPFLRKNHDVSVTAALPTLTAGGTGVVSARDTVVTGATASMTSSTAPDVTVSCLSYYDPYHDTTYAAQCLIPLKQMQQQQQQQPQHSQGSHPDHRSSHHGTTPGQGSYPGTGRPAPGDKVHSHSHIPGGSWTTHVPAGTRAQPPAYHKTSASLLQDKQHSSPSLHPALTSDKGVKSLAKSDHHVNPRSKETHFHEPLDPSMDPLRAPGYFSRPQTAATPETFVGLPSNTMDPLAAVIHKTLNPSWKVDYLDFTPEISGYDSAQLSCRETFPDLIKKANTWLRQNPHVEIKTCETMTWCSSSLPNVGDSESMVFDKAVNLLPGGCTYVVMGVRVWLAPNQLSRPPQRLCYRDFDANEEEKLSELMARTNNLLEDEPLPGKLISFETVMHPLRERWDLKSVFWHEACYDNQKYNIALRLFYTEGDSTYQRLGIHNIVPEVIQGTHEPYSHLMRRASQWVSSETKARVTNLRSTYLTRENDSPSQSAERCTHHFRNFTTQQYFQILRVFFVYCSPEQQTSGRGGHVINCMTFTPVQSSLGMNVQASFEKMKATMLRIGAWISLSGAKIFSLETVVTPLIPTRPNHTLPEVTYWSQALTASAENMQRKFLVHIRIYIDGEFIDPDPRLLPPLPYSLTRELQNSIEEKEIKRFYKKKKMRKTQNRIAIATFLFILVTVAIVIIIERMLKKYYL